MVTVRCRIQCFVVVTAVVALHFVQRRVCNVNLFNVHVHYWLQLRVHMSRVLRLCSVCVFAGEAALVR